MVTQLTETHLKARRGLYAEYVFTFSCGSQRRLSAKDKMSKRVKELVDEYDEWHLSTVGAYSADWIIDQHENADSDEDDEDHRGKEADGEKQDRLWEEDDMDSEPESLSDVLTYKQLAEDGLSNRGLDNYDVIRHIDTWDAQLVKSFAITGDVSTLPRVQRTGVVKITSIGEGTPHHLKLAEGRGPHHLKWPIFNFIFMGLVGYLHAIDRCTWPHLRHSFGI